MDAKAHRLLEAAQALLDAKDHDMVTAEEWIGLRKAVSACRRVDAGPSSAPSGGQCPGCGESDIDLLVWIDDDVVRCARCGIEYMPGSSS